MKKLFSATTIILMLTVICAHAELVTSSVYTGTITELPKTGDTIKKGEVLVKFDDIPINAQIDVLKADIESIKLLISNKKSDCERATKLKEKSISGNDYEDTCYDYEIAKLQLKMKAAELIKLEDDKTCFMIKAPYDCKVMKVFLVENSGTDIGQNILEVQRLN